MDDSQPFQIVVPFDRDDEGFARGVEVGMVYQRLLNEPLPFTVTMHASNAEMALRLAEAVGASASAEDLGDWMSVTYA